MPERVVVSWSGGKDCLLALEALRADPRYEIAGLATCLNGDEQVAMHEVPRALLAAQAAALGLPCWTVALPRFPSNEQYEAAWLAEFDRFAAQGIQTVAFGDLFLADLRAWREALVAKSTLRPVFPLWRRDTLSLARQFIDRGHQAILTCVDTRALAAEFAGRPFDARLLADLPSGVDPCGENGEFHTFVHAGPMFSSSVNLHVAGVHADDRFCWARLLFG
ncbi:MAG: ATP-binding protein [Planctomycetes bacterium]|nr:ATP-binding protein [Planctomycetota bacterium]